MCPQLVLELRILREVLQRGGEQPSRGLLPGREEERRAPHDRQHVRCGAVGVFGERHVGHHVLARLAATVLDVLREVPVEPLQRVEPHLLLAGAELARRAVQEAEPFAEPLVVGLGYAEDVGDDQQRERLGVGGDELAPTEAQELVELPIREPPHEVLVLPEAERGEQPHEQRPLSSVIGRIHRDHVLVHRELVAIACR